MLIFRRSSSSYSLRKHMRKLSMKARIMSLIITSVCHSPSFYFSVCLFYALFLSNMLPSTLSVPTGQWSLDVITHFTDGELLFNYIFCVLEDVS